MTVRAGQVPPGCRIEGTEWFAVSRLLLISCVLLVAGCGYADAAAGVEVVESARSPMTPPAEPLGDDDQVAVVEQGRPLGGFPASGRFSEILAPVDIVSGPSLPRRPESVAVIGDSLTLSAQEEIAAALALTGIEVVAVDGFENRRIASGSSAVPSGTTAIEEVLESAAPELWVIALGTNDVGAQTGTEAFRQDMDGLLGLLPADASVIWVDLWIRDRLDWIVEANEAIRLELGRRRGVGAVVDWHTQAVHPGIITSDGVHLTEDGQQLFADSIVNAIDSTFAN
jgi:lysophospholipase L1-like esterase